MVRDVVITGVVTLLIFDYHLVASVASIQWCPPGDLNPHPLRDKPLMLARIPIPTEGHGAI
jgi:hypothetical protein